MREGVHLWAWKSLRYRHLHIIGRKRTDSLCQFSSKRFLPTDPFESVNWRDTSGMLIMFCEVGSNGASAFVIYACGMAGDCDSYQCGRVHGRQAVSGRGWQ